MPQNADLTTFVALVECADGVQNAQELASVWGGIRGELEAVGAEVRDSYAVLGGVDFLVIYEAPDVETAFQASLTLERHDLDVETMELASTEQFADLVTDL